MTHNAQMIPQNKQNLDTISLQANIVDHWKATVSLSDYLSITHTHALTIDSFTEVLFCAIRSRNRKVANLEELQN